MPFGTVTRFREALAPGGVLLVLGCYAGITWWDLARPCPPMPWHGQGVAVGERLRGGGAVPPRAPVREPRMSLADVRSEADRLLPGSASANSSTGVIC